MSDRLEFNRDSGGFFDFLRIFSSIEKGKYFIVIVSVTVVLSGGLLPLFSQKFIDEYLNLAQSSLVPLVIFAMIATGLVRGALSALQRSILVKAQIEYSGATSRFLVRYLLGARGAQDAKYDPGDLAAMVRQCDRIARRVFGDLIPNFFELAAVPLFFLLMAWFDPKLTLLALFLTAFNGIALKKMGRSQIPIGDRLAEARGRMAGSLTARLYAMPSIRATATENAVFREWSSNFERHLSEVLKLGWSAERLATVPGLINGLSNALLLGVGGWLIIRGELSAGSFVACQTLLFSINDPIRRFLELSGAMQEFLADIRRRREVSGSLEQGTPQQINVRQQDSKTPYPEGVDIAALCFEGFTNIELSIPQGSLIGIVGAEESDRTSLGRIIAGLDIADEGSVRIGGVNVHALSVEERTGVAGYAGSTHSFFSAGVRENIGLWDTTIDDDRIWSALEKASVKEVVAGRASGLDDPVVEAARNYSGGQRQRLALARVLVRHPSVVVIDGTFESIEVALSRRILAALRADGLTVFLTSRSEALLAGCDDLIILEFGGGRRLGHRPNIGEVRRYLKQPVT